MGTITASEIINDAKVLLQDATSVRWTEEELLQWLNMGQREIVRLLPRANSVVEVIALEEGTRQELPAGGIRLIGPMRNMGEDGQTPGRAIREIPREYLDAQRPDWHSEPQNSTAKHFMFDPRTPRVFFIYPPQPVTNPGHVELAYAAAPRKCEQLSETIALDDTYASVLLDYILYRAYSKDAEYTEDEARNARYYSQFATALGLDADTAATVEPGP